MFKAYHVFTDGSCWPTSGGPGGFASLFVEDEEPSLALTGYEKTTTNNRMEIMAVLSVLEIWPDPANFTFYSDSAYVVNAVSTYDKEWGQKGGWINSWRNAGWPKKIKNKDLWIRLDKAALQHKVTMVKVKGHKGNLYNEMADALCGRARREQKADVLEKETIFTTCLLFDKFAKKVSQGKIDVST